MAAQFVMLTSKMCHVSNCSLILYSFTFSGDLLQKTDWHRVCVFKPYLRDTVYRYMNKGQRVLVQGRVTYGEVKDENGVGHITTSIIADDVTFFSKSPHDSSSSNDENP